MNLLGAIFFIVVFLVLLRFFRIVENSQVVVRVSRKATGEIFSSDLSDDEKEILARGHAIDLLKIFFVLLLTTFLAIAFPTALLWIMDYLELISFEGVLEIMFSSWFIISSTIVLGMYFYMIFRNKNDI